MRAENIFKPQYIASAPAAMAARNEFLSPAGASILGVFKLIYLSSLCGLLKNDHEGHEYTFCYVFLNLLVPWFLKFKRYLKEAVLQFCEILSK